MKNQDYIRKAVGLADEWSLPRNEFGVEYVLGPHFSMIMHFNHPVDWVLDALAAQLVRQLDELSDNRVKGFYSRPLQADVYWPGLGHKQCGYAITCGDDRTMNTIKAIVDSAVLVLDRHAQKEQK